MSDDVFVVFRSLTICHGSIMFVSSVRGLRAQSYYQIVALFWFLLQYFTSMKVCKCCFYDGFLIFKHQSEEGVIIKRDFSQLSRTGVDICLTKSDSDIYRTH